jgi:hypothetical protein
MYYLGAAFPAVRSMRLPVSRDQTMLLIAAVNELFLGLDIYLAHSISGTIVPREWIPIVFGPTAGVLLLAAGLLALRRRKLATLIASVIFTLSIVVGLLGAYFHFIRAILPYAPAGERVSIPLLVWAPPILGPLTFSLVGLIGMSAAWVESPADSGTLQLPRGWRLNLPYSKTRAYLLMTGMGSLATLISSVLDHARTGFVNPWLWIPTTVGAIGTTAAITLGFLERPSARDVRAFIAAMSLMLLTGVIGLILHVRDDLTAEGVVVIERFIRGAPVLAPLLFSNMGMIGFAAIMDPGGEGSEIN